jgi:YD repeat-containing protein
MRRRWLGLACVLAALATGVRAEDTAYSYDSLGRLVGVTFTDGGSSKTVTYAYDAAGNRTQVTSALGGPNRAPAAVTDSKTTALNTMLSFDPRTNDTDPDGDGLTVAATTNGAHGTVTSTTTSVTYTPATGYTGSDSFTYTISDGHGGTAVGTVNVAVGTTNQPPNAVDDARATQKNIALTFDPRTNDTDPEGNALAVAGKTDGANGTVTYGSTSVTYTPNSGFAGGDTFTYTLSDGHGGLDTATVTMTVNGPPVAITDSRSTALNTAFTFDPRANDTDPEGNPLTITAKTNGAHSASVTFTSTSVTYTPVTGYTGADSFTYSISDGQGGSATGTVSVTVNAANTAPVAVDDGAVRLIGDPATQSIYVLANDYDLDGDALTITSVTTPSHGATATIVGNHIVVTSASFIGTGFFYTISDGHGGTDTGTVELFVERDDGCPVGQLC